jgi:tetratricopeptide (TPR) repeat protein
VAHIVFLLILTSFISSIEFYVESLDKSGRCDLQVGSLSNIATSYFMRKEYEKSEKYFHEAMTSLDSAGKDVNDAKASVTRKLAYVLYKQSIFDRAYELYTEGDFLIWFLWLTKKSLPHPYFHFILFATSFIFEHQPRICIWV